jgi:hypothetical protein
MDDTLRSGDMAAGWVAIVLAMVTTATIVALLIFFIAEGPFGLINDAGNGLIGVLSAVLAALLVRRAGHPLGVVMAVIGAVVAVSGSWLVMTGATGFLLAGFVSTIGFGLIGAWLAVVAWAPMADAWPGGLRRLAQVTAAAMVIGGIAAVPGAVMGIDDFGDVPAWLWLFGLGWLGTYVAYPVWSLSFGRWLSNNS